MSSRVKVITAQFEGINYAFRFIILSLLTMTVLGLAGAIYNIVNHFIG